MAGNIANISIRMDDATLKRGIPLLILGKEQRKMKMRNEYTCPLEMTHDIIKGKWKPIIMWQLSNGSCSLSMLKKSIAGISQKMLVQHLNDLLEYGMIGKTINDGYPLKSDYFLLERGKRMFEAISIMQDIGIEIMKENHQEDFLKEKRLL